MPSIRYLTSTILLLLVMFAIAYGLVIFRSKEALLSARASIEQGDFDSAIEELKDSISWRAPLNPYSTEAQAEISKIIASPSVLSPLKEKGLRYFTWAIGRSRNVFNQAETASAMAEIERLRNESNLSMAAQSVSESSQHSLKFFPQIVSDLLFWGWIILIIISIYQGFDRNGGILLRQIFAPLIFSFVLYAGWLAALCFA